MDLYRTHPRDLDTFIYKYLQPDDRFLSQVAETIDKICTFLKGQSPYKISKAVKGGSLGKGTAVKNGSDADIVVFLNQFKRYEDQKKNRAEILSSIRELLLKYEKQIGHQIKMSQPRIIPALSSPRTLNFQFKSTESSDFVEVNVLLAFDALGQLTSTRVNNPVYEALIATGERGREFSTCFTELQRNFVKARPTKLKGLIRLVKYWYTEYVCGPCKPKLGPGEYLPLKYALELLIIYAWESAGKGENFSTAEGFRTILKLIVQYKDLLIFWTTNYNFDSDSIGRFLKNKLKETKPMILDPADPTDNVAAAARWDLVAEVAEYCLQQNCVQDVNSWDVKPVKSVLVSVDCMPHPLDVKPPYPIKRIKQEVGNHIGRSNCYLEGNGKMLQQTSTLSDYGIFRNKRIMDLYQTHPCDLDTYIYKYLQPDERFLSQVAETIDKICTFLKGQCPYKISKTVKGGSLGKGTAVKNGSDADMVLFLNYFKSFEDQKKNRAEILSNIRVLLLKYEKQIGHQIKMSQPRIIPASSSPRSINLQFKSTESSDFVEVDVLPAFDALGPLTWTRVNNPVYEALIDTGERGGEFSTCFTELQRNFVKARPTKLKGLIRLVKYWYTEYVRRPYKCQLGPGEYLPPKYALELLIIYAWESAEKGEKFKTAEGFRTVLELIVQYEDLWIFWTTNYNFDSYNIGRFLKNKLKEPKPMILDPADPTGNVAAAARWDLVAEVAEYCLQQNCVQDVNSWDVKPVKSVLVSVDCMPHPLDVNPFYQVRHIIWVAQKHTGKSNCYLEWNGSMLQDTATLSDYGIFHNVTFLLKEDPSWCTLL